jgi:hypothetical protein
VKIIVKCDRTYFSGKKNHGNLAVVKEEKRRIRLKEAVKIDLDRSLLG